MTGVASGQASVRLNNIICQMRGPGVTLYKPCTLKVLATIADITRYPCRSINQLMQQYVKVKATADILLIKIMMPLLIY